MGDCLGMAGAVGIFLLLSHSQAFIAPYCLPDTVVCYSGCIGVQKRDANGPKEVIARGFLGASVVAQIVKRLPTMRETQV